MQRFWKDALCLGVLAFLIVLVFWPALFEGKLLLPTDQFDTMTLPFSSQYSTPQTNSPYQTDGLLQSYPWKVAAQRAFRSGEFFYWNPLVLSGYPQYATSRQTYDVFNLLLIPFDLPFAFTLIIVLELFTAGVGMYFLLRIHGRQRGIALMFAIGWTFNGMFLTDMHILWPLATFCWVPFALAMSLQHVHKREPVYLLAAGMFLGLSILGATLQSSIFAIFVFVSINLLWTWKEIRRISMIAKSVFIPCMIAFALSAIMWIPALELYFQVLFHGTLYSPAHFHSYSIPSRVISFLLLVTFFAPETLGQVHSFSLTSLAGVFPMDFSGYLGAAEMLMALWALFSIRSTSIEVRPYALLCISGFLFPIFTPLYAWLYHRFFIVGTFGLVVLGSERMERFISDKELRTKGKKWALWLLRISLSVFLLIAIGDLILYYNSELRNRIVSFLFHHAVGTPYFDGNTFWAWTRIKETFQHYSVLSPMMFVPFGVIFVISVLLLNWDRVSKFSQRYGIPLLILFSFVQTIFWWRNYLPITDPGQFPLLPSNGSISYLQTHRDDSRTYIHRRGYVGRQYLFLDDLPMLYQIPVVTGYESEVPRNFYPELLRISDSLPHPKTLGFLGVKYMVFYPGLITPGMLPIADSSNIMIYSNPSVRTRAGLYYRTKVLANDSIILDDIFDEANSHDQVLFTPEENPIPLVDTSDAPVWEPASTLAAADNHVEFYAQPSRRAYLVLTDSYYPGWKCFVDGRPVSTLRCNFNMRAVLLEAGTHTIDFDFWPYTAVIGGWCSFSSGLLLVLGFVGFYLRTRSLRVQDDRR